MSAAATRDDLAAVVKALTDQAATQRVWQAGYEAKAIACGRKALATLDQGEYAGHRREGAMYERFAALARGTANAYEVSADMISKYVGVDHGYTRVVNGETT